MAGIESFNPLLYSQSTAALEAAKKNKKERQDSRNLIRPYPNLSILVYSIKKQKSKKPTLSLDQVAAMAREAGLTYGMYVQKYNL